MKKIILASMVVSLFWVKGHAIGLHSVPSDKIWRSTFPSANWTQFVVATGSIILWDVKVASASTGATFTFFNGSNTATINSTSPAYLCTVVGSKHEIRKVLPQGFIFSTTNGPVLQIDWDWYGGAPLGSQDRGLIPNR